MDEDKKLGIADQTQDTGGPTAIKPNILGSILQIKKDRNVLPVNSNYPSVAAREKEETLK